MMASAFNLEAIDTMAPAARMGGLRHACAFSGFSHDGVSTARRGVKTFKAIFFIFSYIGI
jgi:hypothetical protein